MKKYWIWFIPVFLTACVSASESQSQDLYGQAQSARGTADAAMQQAQYQEQFLTATAEAPIVHITETAAGMAIQQQLWTATAQSVQDTQTAALTQTAMSWTATPNATSTAVFAALNAQGTQVANNAQRDNLELERQQYTNHFWSILPGITFAIVAMAFIMGLIWISRREQYKPAPVDARGNILPILNVVDGTVTDVDRNPNYRGDLNNNLFDQWLRSKLALPLPLPEITAERQDATTQRDQLMDLATRGLPGEQKTEGNERKKLAGQEMTKQLSTANLQNRFKVLDETSNLDVIDGQIITVLDAEWKEDENERNHAL